MASPDVFDAFVDTLAAWTETPVVYENVPHDLPGSPAPFVYVEVFSGFMEQDTFGSPGSNEWVETGSTFLHVMVPSGTGSGEARRIAGELLNLFREQPIGTLHFDRLSIGAGDPGETFSNYFAMTATIDWRCRTITDLT